MHSLLALKAILTFMTEEECMAITRGMFQAAGSACIKVRNSYKVAIGR
jgi:hypothetical protein